MHIRILAIGDRMPGWVDQACNEYLKRLPREFGVKVQGIPAGGRSRAQETKSAVKKESVALLQRLGAGERVVALDVQGEAWSTEKLTQNIQSWQMDGRDVSLLIGGPDGLHHDCLARAETRWSLSKLTLPHPLVRIVLLEQFYRAWSIIAGHPYHR